MIYFTSDLHFYHKKPIMGKRTFSSAKEKNKFLIEQWNNTVRENDEVYLLGDISDGNGLETNAVLGRLNGTKYLVIGNNDEYLNDPQFDRSNYAWCKQYYELLTMDTKFVLFHFPIEVWSGYGKDRIHLHGHLHREKPFYEPIRRYEVGVDCHDGKPVSIEEIWERIKEFHNKDRF
ncbi:metallophosphoesterase family protein [Konateibacter massiliensis]|uniref:metallophosphoesterase family protein n=1 Tax=Konateibacter massiliensis TaxID=2002841 RepID=UPI000C15C5FD|nr:metallophosphoesterase family protein [Konateibacter massiliensis]